MARSSTIPENDFSVGRTADALASAGTRGDSTAITVEAARRSKLNAALTVGSAVFLAALIVLPLLLWLLNLLGFPVQYLCRFA